MVRFIAAALVILGFIAEAHADEPRPAQLRSCLDYTIATTSDGSRIGVCKPAKAGGRVTYLRSFTEVKVRNPRTAVLESAIVGFQ
jgi:hypothetical protein